VYKGKRNKPLKEEDEKEFKTVYAMTKYACEEYLKMYHRLYGIQYTIYRICIPYGNMIDGKLSYGTLNHFITKARHGDPITIYGDGSQKRTFIRINDLSRVLIKGAINTRTNNCVFNIGGGDVLSIRDVAEQIGKHFNVFVESIPWPDEAEKIESGDTIFDSSKLDKILNYQYSYSFKLWLSKLNC